MANQLVVSRPLHPLTSNLQPNTVYIEYSMYSLPYAGNDTFTYQMPDVYLVKSYRTQFTTHYTLMFKVVT